MPVQACIIIMKDSKVFWSILMHFQNQLLAFSKLFFKFELHFSITKRSAGK